MKTSVDDSNVNARDALAKPKFVQDQRFGLGLVTAADLNVKAAADVDVTNLRVRHRGRL